MQVLAAFVYCTPSFCEKWRKQKSNSLSFSSHVLFRVELEWNLPAFLSEVGLHASAASKSPCDTSPQCDDYCGGVTVCREFGHAWKLLLFFFVEEANAPKTNAEGILACPFSPQRGIQLAVRALWLVHVISFLTPFAVIDVKTSGRNRSIHLNHTKLS